MPEILFGTRAKGRKNRNKVTMPHFHFYGYQAIGKLRIQKRYKKEGIG